MAEAKEDTTDRLERLLALLLLQELREAPQREKVMQLSLAGFTNVEIADLLETTSAVVAQVPDLMMYEHPHLPCLPAQTRAAHPGGD